MNGNHDARAETETKDQLDALPLSCCPPDPVLDLDYRAHALHVLSQPDRLGWNFPGRQVHWFEIL